MTTLTRSGEGDCRQQIGPHLAISHTSVQKHDCWPGTYAIVGQRHAGIMPLHASGRCAALLSPDSGSRGGLDFDRS